MVTALSEAQLSDLRQLPQRLTEVRMAFALRRLSNEERADHVERLLTAGVEMLEAGGIHAVNLDAVRAQLTPGKIEASLGAQRYLAT